MFCSSAALGFAKSLFTLRCSLTPLCWYSATVLLMMSQGSAYDKGILYISVNMLMKWFVIGKHFNCHSTFSFKSINISEQSFWKETLVWAVMIHASVK